MYNEHKFVKLTITTPDGEVLDNFLVADWRVEYFDGVDKHGEDPSDPDWEGVNSNMSEAAFLHRVKRYVRNQGE